jgi:long-chain acyl-CoA synthetase
MNPIDTSAGAAPASAHPHPLASEETPIASGPRTLGEMVLNATERYTGTALEFEHNGHRVQIAYPDLGTIVTEIARGLIALGIRRGDRVAILGTTSAEWTMADYGALCAGAVVTPIYHTNSPEECAYVLAHSGARLVFCENPEQAAKVEQIRDRCPELKQIVLFNGTADDALSLRRLRKHARDATVKSVHLRLQATGPDDVATLVYTSGTTGPPKGCMLTHANFLAATRMYIDQLGINETHTMYQFLPLAHVLARVAQAVVIRAGARSCYWSGDATKIIDELGAYSPTHFPAVPRIYEKIHATAMGRAEDGSAPERALFRWALACGARANGASREGTRLSPLARAQHTLADRLVLSKIRRVFGPEHQLAMVGAAPVAKELLEFFEACGVRVLEGYGMTESCAAATLNTWAHTRYGTVGRPLPGTEIRIAEDGEILMRGPHVFKGYYHDPEATEQTLTPDGWLCSGDLGSLGDDGFLAITGRKKDLIITSSGKNITPVNIESALRDSRYITEAVVYGDNRPYLVAMVTLDVDESRKLAERLGIPTDAATIAGDPAVRAEIQKEVDAVNAKLARIEQVKRFAILDHDLTQAGGELTPTLKVKRAAVYGKYADVFDDLYAEGR